MKILKILQDALKYITVILSHATIEEGEQAQSLMCTTEVLYTDVLFIQPPHKQL